MAYFFCSVYFVYYIFQHAQVSFPVLVFRTTTKNNDQIGKGVGVQLEMYNVLCTLYFIYQFPPKEKNNTYFGALTLIFKGKYHFW